MTYGRDLHVQNILSLSPGDSRRICLTQGPKIRGSSVKGKKSWILRLLWGRSVMMISTSSLYSSFNCITWNTRITTTAIAITVLYLYIRPCLDLGLCSGVTRAESGKLFALLEQHLDYANEGVLEIWTIIRGYDQWSCQFASYTSHNQLNAGDLYDEEITISQDAPS